jgi:5-methylcytosine-specific restriction protein A
MSPFKSKHPCNFPGCPLITNERYCPTHDHLVKKKYEEERESASDRGYDARWHKVSEMHLNEFPLCVECEKQGKTTAATLTHHIIPIAEGGAVYDWDNLESLCIECHEVKHKNDRWSKNNGH